MNVIESITIRAEHRTSSDALDGQRLVLTYQNSLRVIGHYLDQHRAASYAITESENGFIVTAIESVDAPMTDTAFSECVLQALLREAVEHRSEANAEPWSLPHFQTSNEDMLRAIGYELDLRRSRTIALAVLPSRVVACGWQAAPGSDLSASEPFELILDVPAVRGLLQEARARRSSHEPVRTEAALNDSERAVVHRFKHLVIDRDSTSAASN